MDDQQPSPLEAELERLRHWHTLEIEMVRAVTAFEHALLRPLFLLHGGALVAFLALVGALKKAITWGAVLAISIWAFGFIVAMLATYFAALSQFRFRNLRGDQAYLAEKLMGLRPDPGLYGDPSIDDLHVQISCKSAEGRIYRRFAVTLGAISVLLFLLGLIPAFIWASH